MNRVWHTPTMGYESALEKEGSSDVYSNMDEAGGHFAQ